MSNHWSDPVKSHITLGIDTRLDGMVAVTTVVDGCFMKTWNVDRRVAVDRMMDALDVMEESL